MQFKAYCNLLYISLSLISIHAFQIVSRYPPKTSYPISFSNLPLPHPPTWRYPTHLYSTTNQTDTTTTDTTTTPDCYFRYHPNTQWRKRIPFSTLYEGQLLQGKILTSHHHLQGTTGPKVFFECGVGRISPTHPPKWQMVYGMCRLGTRRSKASAIRKRVSRLTKQSQAPKLVTLYVSKLRPANQQFEVSLAPPPSSSLSSPSSISEDASETREIPPPPPRIPASSLRPHQELIGTVIDVRDYGVLIDVNANRNGLLHIQKVADLNGCYIDKQEGLKMAGLERGSQLRVCVERNEKKRLALDFTPDVKEAAELERKRNEKGEEEGGKEDVKMEGKEEVVEEEVVEGEEEEESSPEYDEAAWADFAAADDYYDGDDDDDDTTRDDGYDEDRNIEDSLGIGYY